jgi:ADP-heptose:LPS heptosyltransferase
VGAPRRDVLVLRALGLGDLLTGVPALRALRDAFPDARIRLACPAWLHELVLAGRLADEAVEVAPLSPLPSAASGAWLGVNLHGRGPESTRVLLAARPRRIVSFRHAAVAETAGLPTWRPREPEAARWCRLLSECGIPADPGRLGLTIPGQRRTSRYTGETVVHPGASAPARRWPWERWATVVRSEREADRRVLLTGTAAERATCLRIAAAAGVPEDDVLAGRTSVLELASVVARAALVLSGDTGVAHLATALGAPSVVLFGPVSPREWGPPPERSRHRALWAGRTGDPHGRVPDPGLLALTPERVLAEIDVLRAGLAA